MLRSACCQQSTEPFLYPRASCSPCSANTVARRANHKGLENAIHPCKHALAVQQGLDEGRHEDATPLDFGERLQQVMEKASEAVLLGDDDRQAISRLEESACAEGLPLLVKFGRTGWYRVRWTTTRSVFGCWGREVRWRGSRGDEQEEEEKRDVGVSVQGKLSATLRFVWLRDPHNSLLESSTL